MMKPIAASLAALTLPLTPAASHTIAPAPGYEADQFGFMNSADDADPSKPAIRVARSKAFKDRNSRVAVYIVFHNTREETAQLDISKISLVMDGVQLPQIDRAEAREEAHIAWERQLRSDARSSGNTITTRSTYVDNQGYRATSTTTTTIPDTPIATPNTRERYNELQRQIESAQADRRHAEAREVGEWGMPRGMTLPLTIQFEIPRQARRSAVGKLAELTVELGGQQHRFPVMIIEEP